MADLVMFGVTEAEAQEYVGDVGQEEAPEFEVYAENWEAVMLFQRLQTQWRIGGMGGITGLDYMAAESVMRIFRIKDRATVFDKLRIMEFAALEALNDDGSD